jgi:hypothetical protein
MCVRRAARATPSRSDVLRPAGSGPGVPASTLLDPIIDRASGRPRGQSSARHRPSISEMQFRPMVVLLFLAQAAAGGWTPAGTRGGVTLAFRDDAQLEVREVRATTELPFPASRIFPLVCDFTYYKSLVSGVQETRLLSGSAPLDYEIYVRYAPRFLVVAARDVVVRVQGQAAADGAGGCQWTDQQRTRAGARRCGTHAAAPRELDNRAARRCAHARRIPGGRRSGRSAARLAGPARRDQRTAGGAGTGSTPPRT